MLLSKRNNIKIISIIMLVMVLSSLLINVTESYAASSSVEKTYVPHVIDCGQCGNLAVYTIERILSRTFTSGSECSRCTRTSAHATDVYTVRRVLRCPLRCTYSIIEHLPTEYRCRSL